MSTTYYHLSAPTLGKLANNLTDAASNGWRPVGGPIYHAVERDNHSSGGIYGKRDPINVYEILVVKDGSR